MVIAYRNRKNIAENLAHVPDLNFETQKIIFPVESTI